MELSKISSLRSHVQSDDEDEEDDDEPPGPSHQALHFEIVKDVMWC
jgi:hypothetical protein